LQTQADRVKLHVKCSSALVDLLENFADCDGVFVTITVAAAKESSET